MQHKSAALCCIPICSRPKLWNDLRPAHCCIACLGKPSVHAIRSKTNSKCKLTAIEPSRS
eukprot:5037887-Amphidinium_carterae.1